MDKHEKCGRAVSVESLPSESCRFQWKREYSANFNASANKVHYDSENPLPFARITCRFVPQVGSWTYKFNLRLARDQLECGACFEAQTQVHARLHTKLLLLLADA